MPRQEFDYIIFHDIENNIPGKILEKWPLHITLTPYFLLENLAENDLLNIVKKYISNVGSIAINIKDQAYFGPKNNILVSRVDDVSGKLRDLHLTLISVIGKLGCSFSDLKYSNANYSPHITHLPNKQLPETDYWIDTISIGKKLSDSQKLIVEKYYL